jgi:acyl carrier protein
LDAHFLALLRSHLKYAGDAPLTGQSCLRDLGLDSMRSIELLFAVEDTYGVAIPDERLTDDTFETAETLWAVVEEMSTGAPGGNEA